MTHFVIFLALVVMGIFARGTVHMSSPNTVMSVVAWRLVLQEKHVMTLVSPCLEIGFPGKDKLVAGFAIEALPEPKVWRMRDGDEDEDEDEKSDGINYEMLQYIVSFMARGDGDEDEDEDEKSDGINYEMLQIAMSMKGLLKTGQDDVVDLSRLVQIKGSKCRGYGSEILHLAGRLAPSGKLNKKPDVTLQLHRKLQWREAEDHFDRSLRGAIQNNFRHCSGAGKVVVVSADVVTFVVTHFSDPRIASAGLRDLLLQSISILVQYKEYLTTFESNQASIHSLPTTLLSTSDNRSWIPRLAAPEMQMVPLSTSFYDTNITCSMVLPWRDPCYRAKAYTRASLFKQDTCGM
ncbi:hypothetical protein Tco_0324593 [Tanacetum coccineum]